MAIALRVFGLVCVVVGALHVIFGLQADQMLGAGLTEITLTNASLDSQNRFYGAQFMLMGGVVWISATDLKRHASLLRLAMAVFFIGGVARAISILLHGWPSPIIQALLLTELVLPPAILLWHRAILSRSNS